MKRSFSKTLGKTIIHKENTKEINVYRVFGNQIKLLIFASLISPFKTILFEN